MAGNALEVRGELPPSARTLQAKAGSISSGGAAATSADGDYGDLAFTPAVTSPRTLTAILGAQSQTTIDGAPPVPPAHPGDGTAGDELPERPEGEGARDEELHVDGEDRAQMEEPEAPEPAGNDPSGDRAAATLASTLASMDAEAEGCAEHSPRDDLLGAQAVL